MPVLESDVARAFGTNARIANIPDSTQDAWRAEICKALERFPEGFLRHELDAVLVVRDIEGASENAGGAGVSRHVLLRVGPGMPDSLGAANMRSTLFAGVGMALLEAHPGTLDPAAWRRTLPPKFEYKGWKDSAAPDAGDASPWLRLQGFLERFATCDMQADVASYAAALMRGAPELWAMAKTIPAVGKKVELTIAWFQKLDPRFTESYFRSLASEH